jgi:hypothetical protein
MMAASFVFRQMVTSPVIFLYGEGVHHPWARIMKLQRKKTPGAWRRTGAGGVSWPLSREVCHG